MEINRNREPCRRQSRTMLIRGGSIAAGHGVTKSFTDIITAPLREQGITVLNRSRYRETTFDGVGSFYEDIDALKPDILLLNFAIDDAFQGVYRSEFQENMVQMIRLARGRFHPEVLLATAHTFDDPYDMDAVNIFYRSLQIVALELNCRLIPVHYFWASYLTAHNLCNRSLVLSDPRYPNERGHSVIATALFEDIRRLFEE